GGTPLSLGSFVCDAQIQNSSRDAWARFQTGGSGTLQNLVVEYDNDNALPTVANDVAVQVYEGESTITNNTDIAQLDCIDAQTFTTLVANERTAFNVLGTNGLDPGYAAPSPSLGDAWIRYVNTGGTPFVVRYENLDNDAVIQVYDGLFCATLPAFPIEEVDNEIIGQEIFNAEANDTYYIRVIRKNAGDMNGFITINTFDQVLGCSNSIPSGLEGREVINLNSTQLNPNTNYYVRVVNISGNTTTTTGTLCIREEVTTDGDLCSVAIPIFVDDCDQTFNLETDFTRNQPGVNPTCLTVGAYRDGWMRFTAVSNNTTIQYVNEDGDAAIAVYRGSCGASLVFLDCADNVTGVGREESINISTIVGLEYYVQILNLDGDAPMLGKYCIFNTPAVDPCDINLLDTRLVGDCNIPFDIPADFDNGGADPTLPVWRDYETGIVAPRIDLSCDPNASAGGSPGINAPLDFISTAPESNSRDGWIRFIGNGNEVTVTYQNKEATSNPAILVYTALAGPDAINCGSGLSGAGNNINQLACANQTAIDSEQIESVTFQTEVNKQYLIRIMDIENGVNNGMTGILCISDGRQDYNTCAQARPLEIGDCSVALNIIPGLNDCSGNTAFSNALDASSTGCTNSLIVSGDEWRYLEASSVPAGDDWKDLPGFNDSSWNTGASQLGFGDNDEETIILPGPTELTYFFRKVINLSSPADFSNFILRILRDDGAIVYVNGQPIYRANLVANPARNDLANRCVEDFEANFFTVDINNADIIPFLVAGDNVIAVEIHNCAVNNEDL
ncbi:MAG: hypothetical protein AAFU64_05255, partial [Bacteroidota bacterium]